MRETVSIDRLGRRRREVFADDVVDEVADAGEQARVGGGHDGGEVGGENQTGGADREHIANQQRQPHLRVGGGIEHPREKPERRADERHRRILQQACEEPGPPGGGHIPRGVDALIQGHGDEPDRHDGDHPRRHLKTGDVGQREVLGGERISSPVQPPTAV